MSSRVNTDCGGRRWSHRGRTFRNACFSRSASHLPCSERARKRALTCIEGPFGEVLRATGPMATANPFRFSTKFQDDETGLLYYGYRYYDPSTGRWNTKDPMNEEAGLSLYGAVGNDPVGHFDKLGLQYFPQLPWPTPPYPEHMPPPWWPPDRPYPPLPGPDRSPLDKANEQFNEALRAWINGEGGGRNYGPDDPWTKQLSQLPVYSRMREEIRNRARKACQSGTTEAFVNKSLKWSHSADEDPWYTFFKDGWNLAFGTGLKSSESTDGVFTITSLSCCPSQVCFSMHVSTTLRLGSASRVPGTDFSLFPDVPSGSFPYTGINFQIPFENFVLSWNWSECLSFWF